MTASSKWSMRIFLRSSGDGGSEGDSSPSGCRSRLVLVLDLARPWMVWLLWLLLCL